MSGLAAILAGRERPGVYRWHGAFDAGEVAHTVEHAGWGFAHVDGWRTAATKAELLAALAEALHFPAHFGHNFDALADCLRDVGVDGHGVVLLWDGWSTLARTDAKAFDIAVDVLASRAAADRGVPFVTLLRGEGPDVAGIASLD